MYNSIYPAYASSYLGINNRRITKKQDDEKSSGSSATTEEQKALAQEARGKALQNSKTQTQQPAFFPNGEKVAVDYTKKQIHITEVFSDFRNTANAIGTPEDVRKDVDAYLELAQKQTLKENPNKQIISSNLKNASQLLDEYITKTLKKPSKVVENWVDTLFLQQIDFKAKDITPVQENRVLEAPVAEDVQEEIQEEPAQIEDTFEKEEEPVQTSEFYVPQDPELKRLFIRAKKYDAIDEKEKALYAFQNVTEYAMETGDTRVEAMARFEQGKLYEGFNLLDDALYNYHSAAFQSDDNNIKAKAYISMGKIYDKCVKSDAAVNHYAAAAAYAGEADNIKLQAGAFSDLAKIHAYMYDKPNAVMFMDLTDVAVEETGDDKSKGILYSKNAKICEKLNDSSAALKFYGKSAEAYNNEDDVENLVKNYMAAAEIMIKYGNKAKAKKLLSKAFVAVQDTFNPDLKQEVTDKLIAL